MTDDEELSISDATLIARLRENQGYEWQDPIWETRLVAADRIEALTKERDEADDLAKAAFADGASNNIRLAETSYRVKWLEAKLAKAVEAMEQIAQPKVGPDFDWTEDETNKWRAVWYRKYQDIARATLAEIKSHSDKFATQKGERHE